MNDDAKAALERLRRAAENNNTFYFHSEDHDRDCRKLAMAYAAERDPTPIDEEWLRSVGFECSSGSEQFPENECFAGEYRIEINAPDGDYLGSELRTMIWSGSEWVVEMRDRSHGWPESISCNGTFTTRGEVRRLAAALGIGLKE